MRDLGRIALIVMSLGIQLLGSITASVERMKVMQGDTVSLTLDMVGEVSQMPTIESLCGVVVTATSKDTHLFSEKGRFRKSTLMRYEFSPMQDCTIDPIEVKVDGTLETTQPIALEVTPMKVTSESPFILSMTTTKARLFVGEPFKVDIVFSQKQGSAAIDTKFLPPSAKDVWIKETLKTKRYEKEGRSISKMSFIMAAQKSGPLEIPPAQIKIAMRSRSRDAFGQVSSVLKWRTYYSAPLALEILPLPSGIDLVGTFSISAMTDTRHIKANEAVHVTLRIEGSGNFEDMRSKKPRVDDVMVYADKAQIEAFDEDGVYRGSWTEGLTFISDRSFHIPAFTIRYFDPIAREIKSKQTEPILIQVEGERPKRVEPLTIKRPETDRVVEPERVFSSSSWMTFIAIGAVGGFLIALFFMSLPWKRWRGVFKRLFSTVETSDYRYALQILINHLDDREANEMVMRIEGVLYEGKETTIDKRALKRLLKRLRSR